MIVPMKHVTLLCVAAERGPTLERLRDLGAVHVNVAAADSEPFRQAQFLLAACQQALAVLADAKADRPVQPMTSGPHRTHGHELDIDALLTSPLPALTGSAAARIDAVLRLADLRQALVNEAERLELDVALYRPFGDFDVSLPERLAEQGLPVQLFRTPVNTTFAEPEGSLIETFGRDDRFSYFAMIGDGDLPDTCETLNLPEAPISALQARRDQALVQARRMAEHLKTAAAETASLNAELLRLRDARDFAVAAQTMQNSGAVAWITGWMPADAEAALRSAAAECAWGLLLRDPDDADLPPTLLRPPRLFRPMTALFQALGIAPAYNEADVSIPFFCFFSVFFAMLVGDGCYGALMLAALWGARRKHPKAPRAPFVLLTCFACATVVWGFLSNTWFGTHPAFMENGVSRWLGDPQHGLNNTMLVCFTLGVAHLSVARVWNAIALFPSPKLLAQVGWLGIVWFMYCMACGIVGIFAPPHAVYYGFAASVLLVFLFTFSRSELREHGMELGIMPLNIVGTLGDIISYVRLFAVGLASVKVAENFNDMALHNGLPLWLKIVPMIAILLIGHGLNVLLAGLSILVHAVRLNTLEFSNHKGISWSGYAFKPFTHNNGETP